MTKLLCLSREQLLGTRQNQLTNFPTLKLHALTSMDLWYRVIRKFCFRNITFEEDKFPAISGLAKEVKRLTGYEYLAGIWKEDIHNGLLWSVESPAKYPSTYVAPSWSWAAIKSGILLRPACIGPTRRRYDGDHEIFLRNIASITHTEVAYTGKDEFGLVTFGKLSIKAPYRSASLLKLNEIRLPLEKDIVLKASFDPV